MSYCHKYCLKSDSVLPFLCNSIFLKPRKSKRNYQLIYVAEPPGIFSAKFRKRKSLVLGRSKQFPSFLIMSWLYYEKSNILCMVGLLFAYFLKLTMSRICIFCYLVRNWEVGYLPLNILVITLRFFFCEWLLLKLHYKENFTKKLL